MDKRKWPWKKKSSDRSPGESESSGSFSSHSERYSDEQEASRGSPNGGTQSPEVTSKATITDDEMKQSVKCLTEKLSAALVNVSAKEDLVKQHAKVAEEAVAGWEKAENEVAALKQQLEGAVQQNVNLEVRASHLDGALKECVKQLRQAREEQEKTIADSILEKTKEWESTKSELEKRILEFETQAEAAKAEKVVCKDPNDVLLIEALEKENASLTQQLTLRLKELGVLTIERDLSTQAAEMASKLQLESNKKVVKLEAECRKLQTIARKSSPANNQKSITPSSFYAESLTDSNTNGSEPGSDSWATALIAELDHFKNEKPAQKNLAAYPVEIDMMDDFLEMERLAALPETKSNTPFAASTASGDCASVDGSLRAELELMTQRVAELESKLEKIEAEKLELENALDECQGSLKASQSEMAGAEVKLEGLQKELIVVNEAKELLEFQIVSMEVETRTMSANVDSLKAENGKERKLSSELSVKCQELEIQLDRTLQEAELHQTANSNAELKLKQEDLAVAADKLAECQKTIASLGKQLQSLATLEDFLIDTSNIPGLNSNGIFARKSESDPSRMSRQNGDLEENGSSEDSPPLSLSGDQAGSVKSRNGFGRFFTRSKSVVEMGDHRD